MVSDIAVLGAVIVSAFGAIFGLYQARKADQSATTTKTIELGVKDLITQYRETNEELRNETHECTERCNQLELEITELKAKVNRMEAEADGKDAEIIRLKIKAKEPLR